MARREWHKRWMEESFDLNGDKISGNGATDDAAAKPYSRLSRATLPLTTDRTNELNRHSELNILS